MSERSPRRRRRPSAAPAATRRASRSPRASRREDASEPKTTRAEAAERRDPAAPQAGEVTVTVTAGRRRGTRRTYDALPDRIDIRDWVYQPTLRALPDELVNCGGVPEILDQGREGACTGFALAAVINFLRNERLLAARAAGITAAAFESVSPRMLYELARRYDEWPGESYEGSSARGAMKGWVRHGVASRRRWPDASFTTRHFDAAIAAEAMATPGGAFYRVQHRNVRDMHAAINETGILYVTLMVHAGWDEPGWLSARAADRRKPRQTRRVACPDRRGGTTQLEIPVILRSGRADSGHAVAIVGYTNDGFIVQNSWGPEWGAGGFALLPYEDYMLHATDVWTLQLGVPVKVDLWVEDETADTTAGAQRAARAVPLNDIRPYVIDVGNNGRLSDTGNYWTTEEDVRRIFDEYIPTKIRDQGWKARRIMLYLHGGLNAEADVARRIVAFRDVMEANEIYPIHIMWETGLWETLKHIIADFFTRDDEDARAGGVSGWLRRFREGLLEARDRSFEMTVAGLGAKVWAEMKENARFASASDEGGMRILARCASDAVQRLSPAGREKWELHVVAHSAGSIFAAHAMPYLIDSGVPFTSLQLMAPAITVREFNQLVVPRVEAGECPQPTAYVLSDVGELDDFVGTSGAYGKSLLFLVSNAFEGRRETPLVGMERFLRAPSAGETRPNLADRTLEPFFRRRVDRRPALIVSGEAKPGRAGEADGSVSRSESHGGFDNDPDTMNSVLYRILGGPPKRPFTSRDLQY